MTDVHYTERMAYPNVDPVTGKPYPGGPKSEGTPARVYVYEIRYHISYGRYARPFGQPAVGPGQPGQPAGVGPYDPNAQRPITGVGPAYLGPERRKSIAAYAGFERRGKSTVAQPYVGAQPYAIDPATGREVGYVGKPGDRIEFLYNGSSEKEQVVAVDQASAIAAIARPELPHTLIVESVRNVLPVSALLSTVVPAVPVPTPASALASAYSGPERRKGQVAHSGPDRRVVSRSAPNPLVSGYPGPERRQKQTGYPGANRRKA